MYHNTIIIHAQLNCHACIVRGVPLVTYSTVLYRLSELDVDF